MIRPSTPHDPARVAAHYDDLAPYYLDLWGEHLHHGLWERGDETPDEATRALVRRVAAAAEIGPGDRVCDVGCGFGATARMLVREYGARVVGLTISRVQLEHAARRATNDGPELLLRDWLESGLPGAAFDAVIAIESSEHVADARAFFREARRVVRPGGRLVVCAWLARDGAGRAERRLLLEPICREGRLAALATAGEYEARIAGAGFEAVTATDLTSKVTRTWQVSLGRLLRAFALDRRVRRFVLHGASDERAFALTVARIRAAYATGSMRYAMFSARAPRD